MRRFIAWFAVIVMTVMVAAPALATVHPVTVSSFAFTPANITISQGDTVVWTNSSGFHNVRHTGTPSLFGNDPASAPWTYTHIFAVEPAGDYPYICDIHPSQMQGTVTVQALSSPDPMEIPSALQLNQNYPNPFNSATTIEFALPIQSSVKLTVQNVLGQTVRELFNGTLDPGSHQLTFDAASLASGMYYYRLETPYATLARKMYFLK